MKLINKYEEKIKNSKFIGYLYEVTSLDETKIIIDNLKKEHPKAKHIPYAYKINDYLKRSDDKEPSGTAGNPILNIIIKKNLNNQLIAIVRYFGGTKLGASNLLRTYSDIAKKVSE